MKNLVQERRYILILGGTIGLVLLLCLSINTIMDPLWYFKGNLIGEVNYAFNERESKTNQFLKNPAQYDCLIFGSSRTTLLDESKIKNHACFNFSFSNGVIEEFYEYGFYLKGKGFYPKLVILGIDDINFVDYGLSPTVPNFILERKDPPVFYRTYLSSDALKMSRRLFSHRSPVPRYYDEEFVGKILPNAPEYQPSFKNRDHVLMKEGRVAFYKKFRRLFPESTIIGYVPPLSAWEIASKGEGELVHVLSSIYEISRFVSPLYDFSIISDVTRNPENSYDGSHYSSAINHLVADRLNQESKEFGIRVDLIHEKDDYVKKFRQAVEGFSSTLVGGW